MWLSNISNAQHFLDHITGHAVEEKSQHGQQQESSDNLDGQPFVLVADQVFNGFEGSEEPQKAGVWAAGRKETHTFSNRLTGTEWSTLDGCNTRLDYFVMCKAICKTCLAYNIIDEET